jgi:LysR family transcriptional regulator, hypochlorite-specific transcription factor HypT
MDTKLLEDLAAVAATGSLSRAAAQRHVTHPAFGRRLKQLEAWAGVALLDRASLPVRLTAAGQALLEQAQPLLQGLLHTRTQLQRAAVADAGVRLRIGTGRTLARTVVADWLTRMRRPLAKCPVEVVTRSMADIAALFERGEVDLLCCYEHPALSLPLSSQRFRHLTVARDRLVPVSAADPQGQARHALQAGPLIAYAPGLALGRLLHDHLARHTEPIPGTWVCDSADAIHEFVRRGLGVAWLPWSLVAGDCRQGLLKVLGGRSEVVAFDVRLYRHRARGSAPLEAIWSATDG